MSGPELRRAALVSMLAAGPPLLALAGGLPPAPALSVAAAIVVTAAGLVATESWLRRAAAPPVSIAATVLTLYGTALLWHLLVEPGPFVAAFVLGVIVVRTWGPRAGTSAAQVVTRGASLGTTLILLAVAAEAITGSRPAVATSIPPVLAALFSSRHGVLFWTPALTIGVAGLVLRALRGRRDAAGALIALGVIAVADASLRPWWAGGFANARVLPALPLLALGLAEALEAVRVTARRHPMRLATTAGVALVAWNLLFMAQYRAETIPRDDTVSFPAVAENSARLVSALAGAPASWPASWLFAAHHRLPVARYDMLSGQDALGPGEARFALGDPDTEEALLAEGWSVRHRCGASICREIEGGRARFLLPVMDPRRAELRIRAQGAGTLTLRLEGREIARGTLRDEFSDLVGVAPAASLHRGPNDVALEVSPGGRAAVESLTVKAEDAR